MRTLRNAGRVGAAGPTRKLLVVGLVALSLLVTLSCGGGGGEDETRAPTAEELREMVMITSEGLPWEVTLHTDVVKSNQRAADEFPDPEQWLGNYEEWGRTGGHGASFLVGGGEISVSVEVEYYRSVDGASKAWAAVRGFALSYERMGEGGQPEPPPEEVAAEAVGDQSVALYFNVESARADSFLVLFRRDGVVALAGVGGPEGGVDVDDAVAVAEQLDSRIQAILER